MMRRSSLLPQLLLAAIALFAAPAAAQWKTPWSYAGQDGPDHWGDLDPAYAACKSGRQQSPIDIRTAQKAQLPALRFDYRTAPLKYLINNGYTIRVNYHAPVSGGVLIVGDKRYQLTQFHFHRPSEELIHGKPYDMAIHLMHESADGQTAGVVILLKTGRSNATIQQIWNHMPMTKGNEHEIPGAQLNPAALLPSDLSYYTYTGSLTAPPCDESVTWFVLKTPVEISREQIDTFAKLYPHDVRPIQALNGRIVKESR
ncbi:MAG TPA: carbonic anhydrase family protein [Bryobacteraceae bacterium]|nr:carbonic anhydrase family protein [Bryobacteraceae bacterium]